MEERGPGPGREGAQLRAFGEGWGSGWRHSLCPQPWPGQGCWVRSSRCGWWTQCWASCCLAPWHPWTGYGSGSPAIEGDKGVEEVHPLHEGNHESRHLDPPHQSHTQSLSGRSHECQVEQVPRVVWALVLSLTYWVTLFSELSLSAFKALRRGQVNDKRAQRTF